MNEPAKEWNSLDDYFQLLEKKAWENYDSSDSLYRVEPFPSESPTDGILALHPIEEGGDPVIFFFTDPNWAGDVAASMGYDPFVLLRIEKQAVPKETIRWDNVIEGYSVHSFYAYVTFIPPEYIELADILELRQE